MGVFNLFRKLVQEEPEQPEKKNTEEDNELDIYSGMRVEVTTFDGRLLFVAKLMYPQRGSAQLDQYSETSLPPDTEPLRVRIRGYNDRCRKAVYMEGTISPRPQRKWLVENLMVARIGNDRAFFRLETNIDATATSLSGMNAGEKSCKLLNISVGGARIESEYRYQEDDKFLLKVQLMEDRELSVMYCQILRVVDKGDNKFEYGCRFLELNEADQAKITQNIFAVQRQMRGSSR